MVDGIEDGRIVGFFVRCKRPLAQNSCAVKGLVEGFELDGVGVGHAFVGGYVLKLSKNTQCGVWGGGRPPPEGRPFLKDSFIDFCGLCGGLTPLTPPEGRPFLKDSFIDFCGLFFKKSPLAVHKQTTNTVTIDRNIADSVFPPVSTLPVSEAHPLPHLLRRYHAN